VQPLSACGAVLGAVRGGWGCGAEAAVEVGGNVCAGVNGVGSRVWSGGGAVVGGERACRSVWADDALAEEGLEERVALRACCACEVSPCPALMRFATGLVGNLS
jgi:hypothetical protein